MRDNKCVRHAIVVGEPEGIDGGDARRQRLPSIRRDSDQRGKIHMRMFGDQAFCDLHILDRITSEGSTHARAINEVVAHSARMIAARND